MEVIKVIVDEIPSGCANCDFLHRVSNQWGVSNKDENGNLRYLCVANGFERTMFNVFDDFSRPDWCPLVTTDWVEPEEYPYEYEGLGCENITKAIYAIGHYKSLADTQPVKVSE